MRLVLVAKRKSLATTLPSTPNTSSPRSLGCLVGEDDPEIGLLGQVDEETAMRVRLSDRKVEEIGRLDLRQKLKAGFSVAPDGSPVFMKYIGTQEIYSLAVKWP